MNLTTASLDAVYLTALCCWREARGEIVDAQRGVIWSILNRAAVRSWWNHNVANDPVAVVLMPKQYSSFNPGDPNSTKFPASTDSTFAEIKLLVLAPGADPTSGATHYFDKSLDADPPNWATDGSMVKTCDLGNLHFWKLA